MARRIIRTIVGLDLSTTATGFVARRAGEVLLAVKVSPPKHLNGLPRICWVADEIVRILDELPGPVCVFSEDFAFAQVNRAHELGGLGYPVWVVPIGVNKKLCTGKGNGKKSTMMKHVFMKWDFDTDDDNIADGFSLSKCGEAFFTAPHNDITRKIHKALRQEAIHVG